MLFLMILIFFIKIQQEFDVWSFCKMASQIISPGSFYFLKYFLFFLIIESTPEDFVEKTYEDNSLEQIIKVKYYLYKLIKI
jgi:hypothetical protein